MRLMMMMENTFRVLFFFSLSRSLLVRAQIVHVLGPIIFHIQWDGYDDERKRRARAGRTCPHRRTPPYCERIRMGKEKAGVMYSKETIVVVVVVCCVYGVIVSFMPLTRSTGFCYTCRGSPASDFSLSFFFIDFIYIYFL